MGHHTENSSAFNLRQAHVIQQRTGTFVLVFSVLLIALTMTLSAVQHRDSLCQDRAHEVTYESILIPNLTVDDIISTIEAVLVSRRGKLDLEAKVSSEFRTKRVEVLDTADHAISRNGFRLLRRTDGTIYKFELRSLFGNLCNAYPQVSMELLQNVDYEKVSYRIKGLSMHNASMLYMLESSLITRDGDRITNFPQLQSLFVGFHGISSAGPLKVQSTSDYVFSASALVYFNGRPLDILLNIQYWSATKDRATEFWRVVLYTESIMAEANLRSFNHAIRLAFQEKGMMCVGSRCEDVIDPFLR